MALGNRYASRQSTAKKKVVMIKVTYPKEGAIEALRGVQCEVPFDVVDKRGWIERRFQEELEAEQSQQARRDKQRETDAATRDELSPEVAYLKKEVGRLQQVIADFDSSQAVQIANNASDSVKTMLQVYNELKVVKDSVETDRQAAQQLREEAAQIKEETIAHQLQMKKVQRNFLAMMNERQKSANEQTERAQQITNESLQKINELNDHLAFGNGLIDDARKFRAENGEMFAQMAAETVAKELNTNTNDLVAFANLVLHAAGVDREKWNETMAQMRTDPTALKYNITRDGIKDAAAEFNIAASTRTEEELAAMHEAQKADVVELPHPELHQEVPDAEELIDTSPRMTEAQERLRQKAEEMGAMSGEFVIGTTLTPEPSEQSTEPIPSPEMLPVEVI